ncbi:MAG: four helix bundle protein [Labilithrix sp.]|nr:four helix bundle protein [Labilithrix sp.]
MIDAGDGARRRHESCAEGGMTNPNTARPFVLPHHKLAAYVVAVELLVVVRAAKIRDARLREQALKSAKSACLNCAEGAGRVTRADKARVFAIARGEAVEAVAAVEIAAYAGDAAQQDADACVAVGHRLVGLLNGLIR